MPAMTEGVQPIPRRWWWTKRVVPVIAIFTAGVIGARIWWARHANRLLQEQLDLIRSRGEPLEWKDLAPEPIPDSENAAELYKQAIETPLLRPGPEARISIEDWLRGKRPPVPKDEQEAQQRRRLERLESMLDPLCTYADFRREHEQEMKEILALWKERLALCRLARGRPKSDWKLNFSGSAPNVSRPVMSPYKPFVKLLPAAALHAHESGDDAEAVEYVRDALALGRSLRSMPLIIPNLLGSLADSKTALAIEDAGPTLKVGPHPPAARREQVVALIDDLLAEKQMRETTVKAFIGQRSFAYGWCELFRTQVTRAGAGAWISPGKAAPLFALVPMFKLDEARLLRHTTGNVEAFKQPTLPAATACLMEVRVPDSRIKLAARFLSSMMAVSLEGTVRGHYQYVAVRRMATTALAIRLYEVEQGRRPGGLEDLVPTYLPAVPQDPFSASGGKVLYRPDGKPPLLYCVGENGQDDGGKFDADGDGLPEAEGPDCVFFLDGGRPQGKCRWQDPTTQPAMPRRINPASRTSAPAS